MEIPTNPTPHVDYENIAGGTLETPVLVDITHGGKDESRIFHFKENEKYFQMVPNYVTKKSVQLHCIYGRKTKHDCPKRLKLIPAKGKSDLIIAKKDGKRNRFFLNRDAPLLTTDWEVVENSGTGDHSQFCKNQVARRDRDYDLVKWLPRLTHY